MDPRSFQPVIIIGAPRSGTNLLRDLLAVPAGATTWPCDEINLLWRHRNAHWPDDALPPERATAPVRRYIRRAFARQARRGRAPVVIEKTCANALRVEFVERVLPEARFIHIVRDGRDAVASAIERWGARFDLRYTLRKARFVPAAELPFYAARFVAGRCWRLVGRQRRLRSWGPRFRGMDRWLAEQPLTDVCAEQWRQCVLQASKSLAQLPTEHRATVRYEDLVAQPQAELSRLLRFAEIPYQSDDLTRMAGQVSATSVGRWRSALDPALAARLTPLVEETLRAIAPPAHGAKRAA